IHRISGVVAQKARRRVMFALAGISMLAAVPLAHAQSGAAQPDPMGAPDVFVQQVAERALQVLKTDSQLKAGNIRRINEVVDEYRLPYANSEKTTRLAAGRHWRDAPPAQRQALSEAFRGTLIRTYSGAFSKVTQDTRMTMLPFRGDASAD